MGEKQRKIKTSMPTTDHFEKYTSKQLKYAKEVFSWMINNTQTMKSYEEFDYPDYAGMPVKLNGKLSSWTVDQIQDDWDAIKKNKSMKYLVETLLFKGWE